MAQPDLRGPRDVGPMRMSMSAIVQLRLLIPWVWTITFGLEVKQMLVRVYNLRLPDKTDETGNAAISTVKVRKAIQYINVWDVIPKMKSINSQIANSLPIIFNFQDFFLFIGASLMPSDVHPCRATCYQTTFNTAKTKNLNEGKPLSETFCFQMSHPKPLGMLFFKYVLYIC